MKNTQLFKLAQKIKKIDPTLAKRLLSLAFFKSAQATFDLEYTNHTGHSSIIAVDPSTYRSHPGSGYGSVMPVHASPKGKHNPITISDRRISNLKDFVAVRAKKGFKPVYQSRAHKQQAIKSSTSATPPANVTRIEYNGVAGRSIIDLVTSTIKDLGDRIEGKAHPTESRIHLFKSRFAKPGDKAKIKPCAKDQHQWADTGIQNGKTWCTICDADGWNNKGHISVAAIRKARMSIARLLKRLK